MSARLAYGSSLPAGASLALPYHSNGPSPTSGRAYGASYEVQDKLASAHGYKLVHVSGFCNLFYVRAEYANLFATPDGRTEMPTSDADVLRFIEKRCQKGFIPSWLNEKPLGQTDLAYFTEV